MKTGTPQIKQHWTEVQKYIDTWLNERQSLILLMCAVDGLREYTPEGTPVQVKIQAFCELLMDYVSAGHFEIYDKLIQEAEEFGEDRSPLVNDLYPKINMSTELALRFNEKYETQEQCEEQYAELWKDMSLIAEHLSERFEMEDQLINALHDCHKDQVA